MRLPPALSPVTPMPGAVAAKVGAVVAGPDHGGVGVLGGGGELVLRREAVVDGGDDAAGLVGELAADSVDHPKIADDPAAAVVVDDDAGAGFVVDGPVDADGYAAAGAGNGVVEDLADSGGGGFGARRGEGAGVARGEGVHGRAVERRHGVDDALRLGVKRHGLLLW